MSQLSGSASAGNPGYSRLIPQSLMSQPARRFSTQGHSKASGGGNRYGGALNQEKGEIPQLSKEMHHVKVHGGAEEDRTPYPHVANVVLYQMSYRPGVKYSPRPEKAVIKNAEL